MIDLSRALLYVSQPYALAVLRPIERALRATGREAAWFFDGPGAEYLRPDERRLPSVAAVRAFDGRAVFVPGNRVPDFFPGAKVEVFHGIGPKYGLEPGDDRKHFHVRGCFDLYCTHGPTTTPRFQKLAERHGHFSVVETGWPKVDPLFWPETDRENPWRRGWASERPIILYGSTFTAELTSAPHLLRSIGELSAQGRYNWIVTLHPKMPEAIVRGFRALEGTHLRFAPGDDVVPLLLAAEAMVSDTSSIVYEFLLLHKAVVTLRNSRPGPHLIDIDNPAVLVAAIDRALARPEPLMREIVAFTDQIHPWRDGRSSERVLDATRRLLADGRGALRRKPLNLWRKLRMRHRLGYWRPG